MLKSKIHRARLTGTKLHYEGSIRIDQALLDAANLLPGEQVDVLNVQNGNRLTTYVIKGRRGSGIVELNGPAARMGYPGDELVIVAYTQVPDGEAASVKAQIVKVGADNRPV
jgi:aspartate 1-decarboxylase